MQQAGVPAPCTRPSKTTTAERKEKWQEGFNLLAIFNLHTTTELFEVLLDGIILSFPLSNFC